MPSNAKPEKHLAMRDQKLWLDWFQLMILLIEYNWFSAVQ